MSRDEIHLVTTTGDLYYNQLPAIPKFRRCLLLAVVLLLSAAAVSYSEWSQSSDYDARSSLSLKKDLSLLKTLLRSDDLLKSIHSNKPSKALHGSKPWPKIADVHGPFPRIGMYGVLPRSNADIVDDLEDPQVRPDNSAQTIESPPCSVIHDPSPAG